MKRTISLKSIDNQHVIFIETAIFLIGEAIIILLKPLNGIWLFIGLAADSDQTIATFYSFLSFALFLIFVFSMINFSRDVYDTFKEGKVNRTKFYSTTLSMWLFPMFVFFLMISILIKANTPNFQTETNEGIADTEITKTPQPKKTCQPATDFSQYSLNITEIVNNPAQGFLEYVEIYNSGTEWGIPLGNLRIIQSRHPAMSKLDPVINQGEYWFSDEEVRISANILCPGDYAIILSPKFFSNNIEGGAHGFQGEFRDNPILLVASGTNYIGSNESSIVATKSPLSTIAIYAEGKDGIYYLATYGSPKTHPKYPDMIVNDEDKSAIYLNDEFIGIAKRNKDDNQDIESRWVCITEMTPGWHDVTEAEGCY